MTEFRPVASLSYAELADLFTRCFAGYLLSVQMTAEMCAARSRRDGWDHGLSFIASLGGQDVAVALIAPRFKLARLAGMGVIESARGKGVGKAALAEFLRRLEVGGFSDAYLEVFEQNEAAVKLYRSLGFQATQRLYGYRSEPQVAEEPTLREVPLEHYVEALREANDFTPILQSPAACATMTLPLRAWTVDDTGYVCFGTPPVYGPVTVSAFVVRASERGQGNGRKLFQAIRATYPASPIVLHQIFPEAVDGFMTRIGFTRMELNQFEMHRAIL